MKSLDSSCQEADFIINDTLKKLKGSNNAGNILNTSAQSLAHAVGSGVILQQQQQQQQFVYQVPLQSSPQQQYHQLHTVLQAACSPTLSSSQQQQHSPHTHVSTTTSGAVTFPSSSKSFLETSLLQAIPQIPAQPPICIFDDDDSPMEMQSGGSVGSTAGLGSIVILTDTNAATSTPTGLSTAIAPSPSSCSSSTTTLSNFNSITSPSPVVPDLLLSTPPGVNSSLNTNINSNANQSTSSSTTHIFQQFQQQSQQHTSSNSKKAEKRPSSSSSSVSPSSSHHHHHHHHQPHNHILTATTGISSPTSSPSKRQKSSSKDCSSSSRSAASSSASLRTGGGSNNTSALSSNSTLHKRDGVATAFSNVATTSSSTTTTTSSTAKFFNIHEGIKDLYLQLVSNDLSYFAETGLKQRTRSFILERLVERERLNTIVINLYPGNKGYSLALHYDEHLMLNPQTNEWCATDLCNQSTSVSGADGTTTFAATATLHKSSTSRNKAGSAVDVDGNPKAKTRVTESDDAVETSGKLDYGLVEVLRWPYENDLLLQCIDRELLPEFLMDMLNADTITLKSAQDGSEAARVHVKPSVFYGGCVIAQIRDFRQTFATSTNICDMKHIMLRPTNATLFSDVQQLNSRLAGAPSSSGEDKLAIESQLVLAMAEPLCLEPDPSIGRFAINAQHERQRFNSHELRRQMKKFTQSAINRKRKLDQFTHHHGLELCDFLTRLRQRPRTSSSNIGNTTPATAPSNNPLVGAMLSSFTSKVPRRPQDVIRPIRPPCHEYPANLKVPENIISVEKYAKTFEPLNEFSEACKDGCQPNCRHNFQPQLIEEYVLETEREANEGRRALYHIKLSIYQRPSDAEYLGELYVDRDYREGERNGESCRFALGTRVHANRYIQQFREIFTEEGRKAVKITHLIPGHVPIVTHTGLTSEQRLLLQQQQQQQRQAQLSGQQQQLPQQQLVVVGNTQQQQQQQPQVLSATVHHVAQTSISLPRQQMSKAINIAGNNPLTIQQTFRQQSMQATQYTVEGALQVQQQQQPQLLSGSILQQPAQQQHIQVQQLPATSSSTAAHQVSLNNGSLVLVQQQPQAQTQQLATLQQSGITIQPANIQQQHQQQQQHKPLNVNAQQLNTANSALRAQLNSNVPILQSQMKGGPISTTQQHLVQKQQQQSAVASTSASTTNNSNISNTAMHPNPAINAIVNSIMNSANQYQQQQQHQQHSGNVAAHSSNNGGGSGSNCSAISNNNTIGSSSSTTLKNSSNASILSLLNSAPAAMTSTPVASGTFTTSTGQQQTLTLVQHAGPNQSQQQSHTGNTADASTYVQTARTTPSLVMATQRKQQSSEVLQNLLNANRKINIVGTGSSTTFRTNSAGNLIAVNLNQPVQQQQQQQQTTDAGTSHGQTVRVSMSALASQLASPPAVMTNPTSNYGAYTVSTGGVCGSLKILNTNQQQQQRILSALRRDSLTSSNVAPPNAIVVGMAAPSPGSDSNASNASGFAVPTNIAPSSGASSGLSALLTNAATPSPSGSDHSQSSQTHQNQALLERLSSVTSNVSAVAIPHMSPQQPTTSSQQQFITKTLVHSPATSSIHSPMSSPHPQPSASPQQQQSQQQQTTATLNLQGINLTQLQGAMANFAGLQNVQVQIPGFTQPISLQFSGNTLQGPVQQHQQQQQTTAAGTAVAVVQAGGNQSGGTNMQQTQQRSVLVSVPVSTQQQQQLPHTITLQTQAAPQSQQQQQHAPPTGTIVSLPSTPTGTQTVVITNNAATASGTSASGNGAGGSGSTTMLTLPIAQIVGAGVQKLNPQTIRTSSGGGGSVGTAATTTMQQQSQQQQAQQAAIQLVGTIQQRTRNIQLVGTKQIASNRQLLTAQRQIGGSTLKIATSSVNGECARRQQQLQLIAAKLMTKHAAGNVLTSSTSLAASPIVMSAQKLQLKTVKAPAQQQQQQQQQQQHRILNQQSQHQQATATATITSQTLSNQQHQQQQQLQHIQIAGRPTTPGAISQRTLTALAVAKQQQQQQQAAVNRRRSTTDATK